MSKLRSCDRDCDRNCGQCPAYRLECEGCAVACSYSQCNGQCAQCAVHCHRRVDLDDWLAAIGGLDLEMPLRPQARASTAVLLGEPYFPQLLNGLQVPAMIARETVVGVGIAKALTPRGSVSRRAIPLRYGPHDLRSQWGVGEETTLLCIGNTLDGYLKDLWAAQDWQRSGQTSHSVSSQTAACGWSEPRNASVSQWTRRGRRFSRGPSLRRAPRP